MDQWQVMQLQTFVVAVFQTFQEALNNSNNIIPRLSLTLTAHLTTQKIGQINTAWWCHNTHHIKCIRCKGWCTLLNTWTSAYLRHNTLTILHLLCMDFHNSPLCMDSLNISRTFIWMVITCSTHRWCNSLLNRQVRWNQTLQTFQSNLQDHKKHHQNKKRTWFHK